MKEIRSFATALYSVDLDPVASRFLYASIYRYFLKNKLPLDAEYVVLEGNILIDLKARLQELLQGLLYDADIYSVDEPPNVLPAGYDRIELNSKTFIVNAGASESERLAALLYGMAKAVGRALPTANEVYIELG